MSEFQKLKISRYFTFILCSLFLAFFIPYTTDAAILYFTPESSDRNIGDTFIQEVRINTEGEFVNVAEVNISFPQNLLTFEDFSKGDSVLTLWLKEPELKDGVISFSGGVPAGFQGSDGLLGRIVFRVSSKASKQTNESGHIRADLSFTDGSRVLINDGKGTRANTSLKRASISINSQFSPSITNEWEENVNLDATSPEPFTVEISNEKSIFDGKYFITFSTIDKQTGVDHYEVLEYFDEKTYENKNAQSPYLLQNQSLGGIIRVSAVDKRGNVAIAEIRPAQIEKSKSFPWQVIIASLVIVAIAGAGLMAWRMVRSRYQIKKY